MHFVAINQESPADNLSTPLSIGLTRHNLWIVLIAIKNRHEFTVTEIGGVKSTLWL